MSILDVGKFVTCPKCNEQTIYFWYFDSDCRGNPSSRGADPCTNCDYIPTGSFIKDTCSAPYNEDKLPDMKKKVDPLNRKFFSGRETVVKSLRSYDETLENRIQYIVESICSVFGQKLYTWYYPGADEGAVGSFDKASDGHAVSLHIEIEDDKWLAIDNSIILSDGEWQLYEIPFRWLTEDFEDELKNGRAAYLQKLEDDKKKLEDKNKKRKAKKQDLIEQIKKKLTPEELKLLKVK